MTRKLKVYGGHVDGQNRLIVAATSMAAAHKMVQEFHRGCSLHYMRSMWCTTDNPQELQTALARPGVLFTAPMRGGERTYVEVTK